MVKYILSIILYFIFKLFTSLIILPTSQKTTITVLLCFFIRHRVQVQAQQQTCWHPHFLSAVTAATTPDPTHLWYRLSSHHQHHNGNSNWDERTYHEDSDMRTTTWGQRHEDDDMRRTTSRTTTWGWWRLRGRQWQGRWHGRHPRGRRRKWHRRQMASMARRQRQASTANGIDSKWHGRQTTTTTDMRRTTRMDDDD